MASKALIPLLCFLAMLCAPGAAFASGSCCGAERDGVESSVQRAVEVDMRHSMRALDDCCDPSGDECPCDSGCEDCSCPGCGAASAPASPVAMSAGEGSWPVSGGGEVAFEAGEQVTARDGAGDLLRPPIA